MKTVNFFKSFTENSSAIKIGFILLFYGALHAQFSQSLEISSYYDDNLYRSPESEKDFLTNLSLGLNYRPEDSGLNLYYKGSMFFYRENTLRDFSSHGVGLDYITHLDKNDKYNLNIGGYWNMRINGDEYNYYDYNQIFAYTNIRFDLDWFFIKSGYNFRYRNYSNLPDLNNYRHWLFIQANKSFDTKTTIILEADLGYKSFAGEDEMNSGGGRRSGHMSAVSTTANPEIPSLSQAIVLARVTQSLQENVGVYLQYRRQVSLIDETSFINSDGYYQDEELFDDPFSYESESYSTQLTWMLPFSMTLQLGGALTSKNYISEQAYISDIDSVGSGGIRLDERSSYFVNFSKAFNINVNWLEALHFNLNYNYIRNESNSYWYDYKNAVIGGGIQWKF